jgi:alpha-amylase
MSETVVREALIGSGQEQDFASGAHDPENRQALWPSNYDNTTTYQRIAKLNQVRHGLIANGTTFNGQSFLDHKTEIIASTQYDVAIRKGPLLAVLTNVSCV